MSKTAASKLEKTRKAAKTPDQQDDFLARLGDTDARRVSQLKRFLSKPPKGAKTLTLCVTEHDEEMTLGRWEARDAVPERAHEIVEVVESLAAETYRAVTARMSWLDAEGAAVTQRYVRSLAQDGGAPDALAIREYDGSTNAQLQQAQNHMETMMRIHVGTQGSMMGRLGDTVDRLSAMWEEAIGELRAERLVVAGLRGDVADLEVRLADALTERDSEQTGLQATALEMVASHLAKAPAGP